MFRYYQRYSRYTSTCEPPSLKNSDEELDELPDAIISEAEESDNNHDEDNKITTIKKDGVELAA